VLQEVAAALVGSSKEWCQAPKARRYEESPSSLIRDSSWTNVLLMLRPLDFRIRSTWHVLQHGHRFVDMAAVGQQIDQAGVVLQ
jgi:hypothetical protein